MAEMRTPYPTPYLLDRDGGYLTQIPASGTNDFGYWAIDTLPPRVVAATLALEDRRFWWHPGVDPIAIMRALWQNLGAGKRISGASTLAMQVVRTQNPQPRTYANKAREAIQAFFLVLRFGHEEVLRQYLRLVPYGNGSHGIAHAARFYFDKPVADLSWAEIAFLAAIPQAPSRMNPLTPLGRKAAILRGQRILVELFQTDVIDAAQYVIANSQLSRLTPIQRPSRPRNALHAILNLHAMIGDGVIPHLDPVDPRLVTTISPNIQKSVETNVDRYLERWRADGAEQAAVIVAEIESGEILAWLGSSNYFGSRAGAIDFARAPRSPGSTLKPFIFALGLDRGEIAPDSRMLDTPEMAGTISNADRLFLGALTPRRALANSRNVPAATLVNSIGLDNTYLFLHLLGLHDESHSPEYYGLSIAIGAMPTTLERLARGYRALANDGMLRDFIWLRDRPETTGIRVMSVDTARLITLFLSDPAARLPSFPRMGATEFSMPVAVKTGTSQGYRDAWTFAYSRKYLVGVWVGRPDAGPMHEVTGGTSAALIAHALMVELHGSPIEAASLSFAEPTSYSLHEICNKAAALSSCTDRTPEWRLGSEARIATGPLDPQGVDPLPTELEPAVAIVSPRENLLVFRNPEMPTELSSLPLKASTAAGIRQVTWYVDGRPFVVSSTGTTARWPLQTGIHTFQVRAAYHDAASKVISVEVQ